MKILNIDSFAEIKRQITLKGKSYPVEEITLQQFIDNLNAAEQLDTAGTVETLARQMEHAATAIAQAIPTLPEAEVRQLKVPAIHAVLQFIRGELDPDVSAAAASASSGESAAEKKPD